MVSAMHQHEPQASTRSLPLKPPSQLPPYPTPLGCHSFGFPASYSKFPLALYFTYGNVYVSILLSHVIPLSSSPTVTESLFFMSVSFAALQIRRQSLLWNHIYVFILK